MRRGTRTIHFEVVTVKATRRFKDADGKPRQQTKKFEQTINPWNTNKDGSAKTREQIVVELNKARDSWLAKPVTP